MDGRKPIDAYRKTYTRKELGHLRKWARDFLREKITGKCWYTTSEAVAFLDLKVDTFRRYRDKHGIEAVGKGYRINWETLEWEGKSDGEISKLTGVPQNTVGKRRRKAGIPHQTNSTPGVDLRKGIDWDAQPLGKVPDSELAIELGLARGTVYMARRKRGIASCKRRAKRKR